MLGVGFIAPSVFMLPSNLHEPRQADSAQLEMNNWGTGADSAHASHCGSLDLESNAASDGEETSFRLTMLIHKTILTTSAKQLNR